MANSVKEHAEAILQATEGRIGFEYFVDAMMQQLRRTMGVTTSSEAVSDVVVEAEFVALRERMLSFFPDYGETYAAMLSKYMGAEHLAECAEALQAEPLQRFFCALRAMQPEFAKETALLSQKIGELAIGE